MALYKPILAEDGWFIGEDKVLFWTITEDGAPRDMSDAELEFVLRIDADSDVLFTKDGADITVTGTDENIVNVAVDRDTTIDSVTGAILIEPGIYYYTLAQKDAGAAGVLAHGPAVIGLSGMR